MKSGSELDLDGKTSDTTKCKYDNKGSLITPTGSTCSVQLTYLLTIGTYGKLKKRVFVWETTSSATEKVTTTLTLGEGNGAIQLSNPTSLQGFSYIELPDSVNSGNYKVTFTIDNKSGAEYTILIQKTSYQEQLCEYCINDGVCIIDKVSSVKDTVDESTVVKYTVTVKCDCPADSGFKGERCETPICGDGLIRGNEACEAGWFICILLSFSSFFSYICAFMYLFIRISCYRSFASAILPLNVYYLSFFSPSSYTKPFNHTNVYTNTFLL